MSDADQSISNFSSSIEDTNLVIKTYIREPATFKMLIMKLQGNILANVNGGIDLVIDVKCLKYRNISKKNILKRIKMRRQKWEN